MTKSENQTMNRDPVWEKMSREGMVAGIRTIFLEHTGSTNDDAMTRFTNGETPPFIVVAEEQSKGRGRLGRPWFSHPGRGLCFTLLLSVDLAPETMSSMSLAVGVACAEAIRKNCGVDIQLKWPNDLIANNRKLGGILCETAPLKPGVGVTVAIGVGINVNTGLASMAPEIRERAISLAVRIGREVERGPLLRELAETISIEVGALAVTGLEPLLGKWRKRDWIRGRELAWVTIDGRKIIGTAVGINREGFLLIHGRDGNTMPVISGDIELLNS